MCASTISGSAHVMLVLIAYALTHPLHAGVSSGARGQKFGLSLHLQKNSRVAQ